MYYEPKYFKPQEFFSSLIYDWEKKKGNQIWRLIDDRILLTADRLRKRFGSMRINNWLWGGGYDLRGYRDVDLDIGQSLIYSKTSQHCFGRAMDYDFKTVSAEEVIQDIIANPDIEPYEFITGLELNTTWVHNDTRSWTKEASGIFTFKR